MLININWLPAHLIASCRMTKLWQVLLLACYLQASLLGSTIFNAISVRIVNVFISQPTSRNQLQSRVLPVLPVEDVSSLSEMCSLPVEDDSNATVNRSLHVEDYSRVNEEVIDEDDDWSMCSQDLYDDLESSLKQRDPFACEFLLSRPEALRLPPLELKTLLQSAYKSSNTKKGKAYYAILATQIIGNIVPHQHPEYYNFLIPFAVLPNAPSSVFKEVIKHAYLLNEKQVDSLVKSIILGSFSYRMNTQLLELTFNLPSYVDMSELSVVKQRLSSATEADFIAFALASTLVIRAWKCSQDIIPAIQKFYYFAAEKLKAKFYFILHQLESVFSTMNYFKEASPPEIVQVLELLHLYARLRSEPLSESQRGIEDLLFYARGDLAALIKARLKLLPRLGQLRQQQLVELLQAADSSNPDNDKAFLALLNHVHPTTEDLNDSLPPRIKWYIQATSLMPAQKIGEPCTNSKEQIEVIWNIPEQEVLTESAVNYDLFTDYHNLPALFLYRAFGIPEEESKVLVDHHELPDRRELTDTANFFGHRWCSLQGKNFGFRIK